MGESATVQRQGEALDLWTERKRREATVGSVGLWVSVAAGHAGPARRPRPRGGIPTAVMIGGRPSTLSNGHSSRRPESPDGSPSIGAATLVGGLLLAPAPGSADPRRGPRPAGSARQPDDRSGADQLAVLNRQADIATEAYNTTMSGCTRRRHEMTGLRGRRRAAAHPSGRPAQRDRRRRPVRLHEHRRAVSERVFPAAREAARASSSTRWPPRRSSSTSRPGMLTLLTQQQNQLGAQEQQAARELATITADRSRLAAHKAAIEKRSRRPDAARAAQGEARPRARSQRAAARHWRHPSS